jgi:hypothetical protein
VGEPYDRQDEQDWDALAQASRQALSEEAAAFREQHAAEQEPLPDPVAVLAAECQGWLSQALSLRAAVKVPPASAPQATLYEAMVTAGAHLDTMETLLSQAIGFKGAAEIGAKAAEAAAEDAWEDQAGKEKQRGSYGREYQGAKERYAYWSLATRQERSAAREARRLADVAGDVERRVRLHYYGLLAAHDALSRRLAAVGKLMYLEG